MKDDSYLGSIFAYKLLIFYKETVFLQLDL